MEIEILTTADYANIYQDKLVVNGPFNQIKAQSFPINRTMGFAMRARLEKNEEIFKSLDLILLNPQDKIIGPQLKAQTTNIANEQPIINHNPLATVQLAINWNVQFEEAGLYHLQIKTSTGFIKQLPILVSEIKKES